MKKIIYLNRNHKGWIRIVEAFSTILVITGILLIVLNKNVPLNKTAEQVYDIEYSILREIQLNNGLRTDILGLTLPTEWTNIPTNVKDKIISRIPANLECKAKVCAANDVCVLDSSDYPSLKDIYIKSAFISADLNSYLPRQLKLFCWEK